MIEHHNRATYNNPKHSQAPRRGTERSEALASRAARPDSAQNNSGDTRTQARRPTHRAKQHRKPGERSNTGDQG